MKEGGVPAERNGVGHYPHAPKTTNANGGKNILRLLLKYGGAGVFRDKGLNLTKCYNFILEEGGIVPREAAAASPPR